MAFEPLSLYDWQKVESRSDHLFVGRIIKNLFMTIQNTMWISEQ
jgi:hypothetical protein